MSLIRSACSCVARNSPSLPSLLLRSASARMSQFFPSSTRCYYNLSTLPDPDRVVAFSVDAAGARAFASDIKFNLWREQTSVFEQQSAYRTGTLDLTGLDQPQKLNAIYVTTDYFRLFGLSLVLGRSFGAEEELPNGPDVVLLSNDFWHSLGGSSAILGKTLLLGGKPHEVIGVMAGSVQIDMIKQPDVWLPFPLIPIARPRFIIFRPRAA